MAANKVDDDVVALDQPRDDVGVVEVKVLRDVSLAEVCEGLQVVHPL